MKHSCRKDQSDRVRIAAQKLDAALMLQYCVISALVRPIQPMRALALAGAVPLAYLTSLKQEVGRERCCPAALPEVVCAELRPGSHVMGKPRTSLAQRRRVLGYTQQQLADAVGVELSTVGRWERGTAKPQPWARRVLADELQLSLPELDRTLSADTEHHLKTTCAVDKASDTATFADLIAKTPGQQQHSSAGLATITLPAGRALPGSSVAVTSVQTDTILGNHIIPTDDVPPDLQALVRGGHRSLVVTMDSNAATPRARGIDGSTANRQLVQHGRLSVPEAFRLDELTVGLLWALINYDDAALTDDDLLGTSQELLDAARDGDRALPADVLSQMSHASRMMLGSQTCAGFILDNLHELDTAPTFWTREQHGEEASSWLLFRHKLDYLISTGNPHAPPAKWPTRVFCVPKADVDDSVASERVLLLLAAALMESTGIRIYVTGDAELSAVDGFVLGSGHALIANWVRTGSVWHTNHVRARYRLDTLNEISQYGMTTALNNASSSAQRLAVFADYLNLDWAWLVRRCRTLGEQSFASLARPRSRRISTAGADRACRYLAHFAAPYSIDTDKPPTS